MIWVAKSQVALLNKPYLPFFNTVRCINNCDKSKVKNSKLMILQQTSKVMLKNVSYKINQEPLLSLGVKSRIKKDFDIQMLIYFDTANQTQCCDAF